MNVGESLKRKIGPLPVWAWAAIGFVGIWYYRNRLSAASTVSGTGTGSVGPAPATPQAQTVLQPGESVYDPNTGTMSTAPGGDTTGSTPPDYSGLIQGIADAIVAAEQATAGAGGTSSTNGGAGTAPTSTTPAASTTGRPKRPKLTARGAVYAPFGHNKPKARKGFTIKGLGRGFWEYVPVKGGNKRSPKSKHQHGPPKPTTKDTPKNAKSKPRSPANQRNPVGGRTSNRVKAATRPAGKTRGGAKPHATQQRQVSTRRTTPVVTRPTVRQRPVATATPKARVPAGRPAHPSSPPARTHRTPARRHR